MSESSIRIWKYPIRPDLNDIQLPVDAEFLCVGVQQEQPQLWVKLDKNKPLVTRRIRVYGTGHEVPNSPHKYIGTFFLDQGSLVFHVFEQLA